jgi:hypothetical protein
MRRVVAEGVEVEAEVDVDAEWAVVESNWNILDVSVLALPCMVASGTLGGWSSPLGRGQQAS